MVQQHNSTVNIIIGISKSRFLHEKCTQLQDTKTSMYNYTKQLILQM